MAVIYPRCWIKVGGILVPCASVSVTRKGVKSSDEFTANTSVAALSRAGISLAQVADWDPQDVTLVGGIERGEQTEMVTGKVDMPEIVWDKNAVSFAGRDKSTKLVETRVSKSFRNMKSSEIIEQVAGEVGLTASVQGSSGFAGKTYYQDTVHMLMHKTYHELISDLAEREGYEWFVNGTTLYFQPKGQSSGGLQGWWCPPGVVAPYGWATIQDLTTSRNMTAAKPHEVKVKSLHHRDKKQYEGKAEEGGVGDKIIIEHHHNGNNQEQADTLAKSRLKDAIRHDCNCTYKTTADLSITPQLNFTLGGTRTIFDQSYDHDQIQFEIGWDVGGTMEGTCKSPKASRGGGPTGSDGTSGTTGATGGATGGTGGATGGTGGTGVPEPPPRPSEFGGGAGADQEVVSS